MRQSIILFAGFLSQASAIPVHDNQNALATFAAVKSRSPCPALNVLANIGKLPNDGQNITSEMFVSALTEVYNVDPGFAKTLASQGLSGVPHAEAGPNALNLADLDLHDAIEHDASLTRLDAKQGDNHTPQAALVEALLADSQSPFLDIQSLAKSRTRREKESREAGSPALSVKASTLAHGESALLLQVLGHLGQNANGDLQVPKAAAQSWLLDEQLPAGWKRPSEPITLGTTTALAAKIVAAKSLGAVEGVLSAVTGAAKSIIRPVGAY